MLKFNYYMCRFFAFLIFIPISTLPYIQNKIYFNPIKYEWTCKKRNLYDNPIDGGAGYIVTSIFLFILLLIFLLVIIAASFVYFKFILFTSIIVFAITFFIKYIKKAMNDTKYYLEHKKELDIIDEFRKIK